VLKLLGPLFAWDIEDIFHLPKKAGVSLEMTLIPTLERVLMSVRNFCTLLMEYTGDAKKEGATKEWSLLG
jgi:hypothetical protein